ncbi:MAG: hypothetical protein EOO11_03245 [Chitinophagaceae bacterium]|nr:MAG: hypothetical protein EOO11_03245 [Chitinophagaceae bacterium]
MMTRKALCASRSDAVKPWMSARKRQSLSAGIASRAACSAAFQLVMVARSAVPVRRVCTAVPKLERHFRKLIQWAYVASLRRIHSTMSKPALGRYQKFIEKYPQIDQRVPDHYIASYLGITPQSLSRVRRQSMQAPRK